MAIRRIVVIFFIACAAVVWTCRPALAADPRQVWDQPTHKWIKGPVGVLATPEEIKQFKEAKTDEQVAAFVKDFWARRDPTPGTPQNEFADLFWKRVAETDKQFQQTTDPGPMSDRGQVYLLLGRPTRMGGGGKTLDWIYENVPNMQPSTFTIQFTSGGAGNPLLLGRKGYEQIVAANEFLRGLGPKAAQIYAPKPAAAELPAAVDVPAPPVEVATAETKLLDDNALNDALPTAIPFAVRVDLYQATKGDSFVVITLAAARKDVEGASPIGFARLIPYSSETKPVTLAAADSFGPAQPENNSPGASAVMFQAGVGAHPGKYSLLVGLRDPASGKLGMVRQPLEVPSYTGGVFQISTVTLATDLKGPVAVPDPGEGKRAPFYLGSFRVVPSMDAVFHQGTNLAWYYQIYNATPDPATGKPNLTLEYDFLLKQLDKAKNEWRFLSVTKPQIVPNRSSQVEAFSFQLVKPVEGKPGSGWVAGEYQLSMKVTDEVGKNTVTQVIPFTVVP